MKKQFYGLIIWIFLMTVFFFIYDSLTNVSVGSPSASSITVKSTVLQTDSEFFKEESKFPDSFYIEKINSTPQISSNSYSVYIIQQNDLGINNPFFNKDQILLMNQFFINSDKLLLKIFDFLNK